MVDPVLRLLPKPLYDVTFQDLWPLYGWNTFAALFNPLWAASLGLTLVTLEPMLKPMRPTRTQDLIRIAVGFGCSTGYALTRPSWSSPSLVYGLPWARFCVSRSIQTVIYGSPTPLYPLLLLIAAIVFWQSGDTIFRRIAGNSLGHQSASIFWYPLTLGLTGLFAIQGLQRLTASAHPWRYRLGAWLLAVVFLHTSPLLNGYHFVFQLYLPICFLAAPVVRDTFEGCAIALSAHPLSTLLLLGLFLSCAVVTRRSLGDLWQENLVPQSFVDVARLLADKPTGNVLAMPGLGNILPAYGPHRVYVGHWFLTREFVGAFAYTSRLSMIPGTRMISSAFSMPAYPTSRHS